MSEIEPRVSSNPPQGDCEIIITEQFSTLFRTIEATINQRKRSVVSVLINGDRYSGKTYAVIIYKKRNWFYTLLNK
jgi:hypothetical protein